MNRDQKEYINKLTAKFNTSIYNKDARAVTN